MKKMIPLFVAAALLASCASAPVAPKAAAAATPVTSTAAAAPAAEAPAPVATLAPDVAKLPFADHIVLNTPVPDKPGVTAVLQGADALITWETRIPAADIRIVGDFQGWKPDMALPMFKTKNAAGKSVWYITLKVPANAVLIYKYYVNGQWTEDAMAPVSVDDGYGGHNGKADAVALLAAK